jgi:UDP-GlcNAc:undecaprenyl-phosphate GlcNAc-1-phosphate transferase
MLDFSLAVIRRLRAGKSPFSADRQHIHHRLQDLGHGHLGAVLVFYLWTGVISISCILVFFIEWQWVMLFFSVGILVALAYTVRPVFEKRKGVHHVNR